MICHSLSITGTTCCPIWHIDLCTLVAKSAQQRSLFISACFMCLLQFCTTPRCSFCTSARRNSCAWAVQRHAVVETRHLQMLSCCKHSLAWTGHYQNGLWLFAVALCLVGEHMHHVILQLCVIMLHRLLPDMFHEACCDSADGIIE